MTRAVHAGNVEKRSEDAVRLLAHGSPSNIQAAAVHAELAKASAIALLAKTVEYTADLAVRTWGRK